ncbi:MAG: twin-arginine translocation signal domain-containing protein, partial [Candidatus Hydrogenedentota bacterium]
MSTPKNDSKKQSQSRRGFLKAASAAAAGAVIAKNIFPGKVLGANERILTGHIGTGGMGTRNLELCVFREKEDIQPIAVCDLWEEHRMRAADLVSNKYDKPSVHIYHEEIIDNKDIDVVVVVTPDHWHTIPSI